MNDQGIPDQPLGDGAPNPATTAGWGPVQVLAGLGALLFAALISTLIIGTVAGDPAFDGLGTKLAAQAMLAAALAGAALLAAGGWRETAELAALGLVKARRNPVWAAIGAFIAYAAAAAAVSALLHPQQEDVTRELGAGEGALGDVASFILVVIAAPVSEEIFFRGFMFAGIRSRAPFWPAAVISAMVWGAFHYTGAGSGPVVLQLTMFGLVLAWLYERTGSIRPTIAVHLINNALAFIYLTGNS